MCQARADNDDLEWVGVSIGHPHPHDDDRKLDVSRTGRPSWNKKHTKPKTQTLEDVDEEEE